jgi:hypothetical protein
VQPQVATKTSEPIKNSGSAFFNGILKCRFIILANVLTPFVDDILSRPGWPSFELALYDTNSLV